jgi:hypothetical protein
MLSTDYIYKNKREFTMHQMVILWGEKASVPERDLTGLKRRVVSASHSDAGMHRHMGTRETKVGVREKRREPRFTTNDSASFQLLNPFSHECWRVWVLDVSKNGLGLFTPRPAIPGSDVKVRMKDCVAFGNTRYCVPTTEGFLVGVQLHDQISCCTTPKTAHTEATSGGRKTV